MSVRRREFSLWMDEGKARTWVSETSEYGELDQENHYVKDGGFRYNFMRFLSDLGTDQVFGIVEDSRKVIVYYQAND